MKLLLQTFGWVLVLLGLLVPPGVYYLDHIRPEMVDTYRDTYQDFSQLPEDEQKRLLDHLDFMIAADVAVRNNATGVTLPPLDAGEGRP